MPCMGRRYCPVRIFLLWAIVCMHSNKGSNKVVKQINCSQTCINIDSNGHCPITTSYQRFT